MTEHDPNHPYLRRLVGCGHGKLWSDPCVEYENAVDFAGSINSWAMPRFPDLPRGGIVGRARIVDCVTQSDSPWFVGRFGFVLADVEPLPFVECRGALALFPVPQHVLDRLHDADGTSTHDYEGACD